jgi:hypothetical protein
MALPESAEVPQVRPHDLPDGLGVCESEVPEERAEAEAEGKRLGSGPRGRGSESSLIHVVIDSRARLT